MPRIAHWVVGLFGLVSSLVAVSVARAEQVLLADVTYTHSAETTSDSHYRVAPRAGTPANWKSPVDFTKGSVHVLLEVKTKPAGDAPTKFQICFEATPAYACTDQSPTYTKPGKVEWTARFSNFWYGGDVDWTKGTRQIALILKDTMNNKPAGDPKYMPTDLRVEVTLLSEGANYVAPIAGTGGAGAAGAAGAPKGGMGGAGAGAKAGTDGAGAAGKAGSAGVVAGKAGSMGGSGAPGPAGSTAIPVAGAAGASVVAADAGDTAGQSGSAGSVAATETSDAGSHAAKGAGEAPSEASDSGCSAARAQQPTAWTALLIAGLAVWLQRRRTRA